MQYLNTRKAIGLILALAFFIGGTHTALAVGTASNTTISNTATVDYDVAGDSRSASSGAVNFVVDNKVDLTVTNLDAGNNVNVIPGSTDRILTYTVTNTGNTTQGYLLTVAVPTANIPMGNIRIYVDANNDGVPDAGEIYATGDNAGDLDPNGVIGTDDVMQVLVVADTPAGATDTTTDDFRLVARTTIAGSTTPQPESPGPNNPAVVEAIFADGVGTDSEPDTVDPDGYHSAAATYTVESAALTAVKTIASTTDGFGSDFAIPGAYVEYQIRVTNSGVGAVDNNTVVVNDPIPTNTKLCVNAACGGLPTFVDGATTSALTAAAFEYSIAGTPNECADASFTGYVPTTVVDGDGANPNITCVRQAPTGSMAGSGGFFDIQFFVVIE